MGWFLDGLVNEGKRRDMGEGLKAAIWLYYNNYDDSTKLDQEFLDLLDKLVEHTLSGIDVEELVREAEGEINDNGGVMGETTGRHKVRTFEPEED